MDFLRLRVVAGGSGTIPCPAAHVGGGAVGVIHIGGLFGRAAAVEPDGVVRPGIVITFVEAVVVGIEALAGALEMKFEHRQQVFFKHRIGS